jgi:hypothetical protein
MLKSQANINEAGKEKATINPELVTRLEQLRQERIATKLRLVKQTVFFIALHGYSTAGLISSLVNGRYPIGAIHLIISFSMLIMGLANMTILITMIKSSHE